MCLLAQRINWEQIGEKALVGLKETVWDLIRCKQKITGNLMQLSRRARSPTLTSYLTNENSEKEESSRGGPKGCRGPQTLLLTRDCFVCFTIFPFPTGGAFCGCPVAVSLLYVGCGGEG